MSRKVPILVPAPIRHIPARSRAPKTAYAPMVEEVELREISRAEAPRGPSLAVNGGPVVQTRLVDGAAWRPIGRPTVANKEDDAPGRVSPGGPRREEEGFVAWLAGAAEADGLDMHDLKRCLEGTPLLARVPGQKEPLRPDAPWNAGRQGTLLLDGREAMPRLVRDYMADNVALIDGRPFMRMPGPVAYLTSGARAFGRALEGADKPLDVCLLRHPGGWTTNSAINFGNLCRFDRIEDLHRSTGIRPGRMRLGWDPKELSGLAVREGDDLMLMLRESLRMMAAHEPREGYPFDKGRLEAFQAYVALGSVGAIPMDDLATAWTFVRDFAASVVGMETLGWVKQEARRIHGYAEAVAVPRLADRLVSPDEDAGFLATLSRA